MGAGGQQDQCHTAGLQSDLEVLRAGGTVPAALGKIPKAAVDYVAGQVKVDPELFADYKWVGSTIEFHRKQIREALGSSTGS
ncbi:MAG: DUF4158 domain-containing protein [Streptosporangiales bacterium]